MPRQPQQARAKATADAIIEAGFKCVAKHGMAGTTTRQIIEIAGVSPGSFYEYFSNKEMVFEVMYQRFVADALTLIEPLSPQLVQMDIEDLIRALLARFEMLLKENDGMYLKCAQHAAQVEIKQYLEPAAKLLRELVIQHAISNPQTMHVRDLPTLVYIFVHGGIALIIRHLTDPNPPISFEQLSNGLATMVGYYVRRENELARRQ